MNISHSLQKSLEEVMAYSHPSLVHRAAQKLELSNIEARLLFEDTKRFLFICATQKQRMSPPKKIDLVWHEFLLFSKDYAVFCETHFGAFIHHRPRYLDDPPADGSSVRNTINVARRLFGNLSDNWAECEDKNCDCEKCAGCKGGD